MFSITYEPSDTDLENRSPTISQDIPAYGDVSTYQVQLQ